MIAVILIFVAIIAYALGSLNGAIITSKALYRKDIRKYGSGNAGLTNTYRVYGLKTAAIVLTIDIMKGVIGATIGGKLMGMYDQETVGQVFAGFCAILGHCYPIYYGFRGGKGALAGFSMLLVADYRVAFLVIFIFLAIVIFTRLVSLGSLVSSLTAPIFMLAFGYGSLAAIVTLLGVLLIIFAHRENIGRLITRTESKLNFGKTVEQKIKEQDF